MMRKDLKNVVDTVISIAKPENNDVIVDIGSNDCTLLNLYEENFSLVGFEPARNIKFIDEGIFTLIEKRDSSYLEYDRTYRIDMLREVIVIDTLGTVPVKDSLFGDSNHYKEMAYIPIEGVQDSMFKINSEVINKNGYKVPVFEVKVTKNIILAAKNLKKI